MTRRVLFATFAGAMMLAVVEGISWWFFTRIGPRRLDLAAPERYVLGDTKAVAVVFDPELGWLSGARGALGERPRPVDYGRPYMLTFGDSHTRGEEIEDGQTWQTFLSDEFRADVLNFGVTAFGPDQALLYYRRVSRTVHAPIVALAFPLEGINRIVNVYRPFYYPPTGAPLTKPRFVLEAGGLRLLPNPVQSAAELEKLRAPEFIDRLGQDDFWYRGARRPQLRFPYARLLFHPGVWRQALLRGRRSDTDPLGGEVLWGDPATRALMLRLTDTFVAEAEARGSTPIVLLMPLQHMIRKWRAGERIKGHDELLRHCAERSYPCFDGIEAVAAERLRVEDLFMPGGHLSPSGTRALARHLAAFLRRRGLAAITARGVDPAA